MRSLPFALACGLVIAACGGQPPAVFVGESAHFRLYVDPALMPLPAVFAGDNALAALETHWSDVATMLAMPDGKVAYYWYTTENIAAACGDPQGGCTKEDELEVDAVTLPNAHELTHAYLYLRARRRPVPFLSEGIAEAIGCGEEPTGRLDDADWRSLVASLPTENVYGHGGLLVRYLIRTQGIDQVLRYYEQSPERRDPALFGANFESFWGVPFDDVWSAAHAAATPASDYKICPCALPPLDFGSNPVDDPARTPYWTLPGSLDDTTIALTEGSIWACSGAARAVAANTVLARTSLFGPGWYVRGPLTAVALDRFISEDCADVARYQLPPVRSNDSWLLDVNVPAVAGESTLYLAIDSPSALRVRGPQAICDSCDFDPARCPAPSPNDFTPVSGQFYARLRIVPNAAELRIGDVRRTLWFLP